MAHLQKVCNGITFTWICMYIEEWLSAVTSFYLRNSFFSDNPGLRFVDNAMSLCIVK